MSYNISEGKYQILRIWKHLKTILLLKFNFEHQLAFVRFIGTHFDYDKIDANNV